MHESQSHRPPRVDHRGASGYSWPFEAVDGFADSDAVGSGGLGLIARDLARKVGGEIVVLAVGDETGENVEVLAAWGGVSGSEGLVLSAPEGFVGRVLSSGHATVEPLDPGQDNGLGVAVSGTRLTHAAGVAVSPPGGLCGALCVGFSRAPQADPAMTLWIVEAYARLASLCLLDPEALDGLLAGAHEDALTGCLNYAAIRREVVREISRADRNETSVSCCFIDLDHFKRVNDSHGHLHGSRVLASVASALRAGMRSCDTVGRYGGDEFVVLLPDTDERAAVELAKRLRATIAGTKVNFSHDLLDASIGVAERRPGTNAEELLADADEALCAAKAAGRSAVLKASDFPPAADRFAFGPKTGLILSTRQRGRETDIVKVEDVLDVLADCDCFGGASFEFVAWELETSSSTVKSAWSQALGHGLLKRSGTDPVFGEDTWRLSEPGRHAHSTQTVPRRKAMDPAVPSGSLGVSQPHAEHLRR